MSFLLHGLMAATAALLSLPAQIPTPLSDSIPTAIQKDMTLSGDSLLTRHIRALGGMEAIRCINSVHEIHRFSNRLDDIWIELGKRYRGTIGYKPGKKIMEEFATQDFGFGYQYSESSPCEAKLYYPASLMWSEGTYPNYLFGRGYYTKLKFLENYQQNQLKFTRIDKQEDSTYNLQFELSHGQYMVIMLNPESYLATAAFEGYVDRSKGINNRFGIHKYADFKTTSSGLNYASSLTINFSGLIYTVQILEYNFPGKENIFVVPRPEMIDEYNRWDLKRQFSLQKYEHPE